MNVYILFSPDDDQFREKYLVEQTVTKQNKVCMAM
jgi:hypothetical protein